MVRGNTRRVVVIRDISSSHIEEAILILKNEPEDPENGLSGKTEKAPCADSELLLKEAEEIIDSYIRENHLCKSRERRASKETGWFEAHIHPNLPLILAAAGSLSLLGLAITLMF